MGSSTDYGHRRKKIKVVEESEQQQFDNNPYHHEDTSISSSTSRDQSTVTNLLSDQSVSSDLQNTPLPVTTDTDQSTSTVYQSTTLHLHSVTAAAPHNSDHDHSITSGGRNCLGCKFQRNRYYNEKRKTKSLRKKIDKMEVDLSVLHHVSTRSFLAYGCHIKICFTLYFVLSFAVRLVKLVSALLLSVVHLCQISAYL